jgi:predicted transposase YdaD
VDEKLKDKHSDIVYKTRINGLTAFLYLLFEHQSTPDPMMVFRLLCYMVNLWKEYTDQHSDELRLPFVMPVVLYHGTKKWTSPMHFSEMFRDKKDRKEKAEYSAWHKGFSVFIPDFTYEFYDLSKYPDDRLMLGSNMALTAMLIIFKHIYDEDINPHICGSMKALAQFPSNQKILKFLEILLRYIYHARNDDEEVIRNYTDQGLQNFDDERIREVAMTVADQIEQRGMLQEAREMVIEVLEAKFKGIPNDIVEIIKQIGNRSQLKQLVRQAVSCESFEAFRKNL